MIYYHGGSKDDFSICICSCWQSFFPCCLEHHTLVSQTFMLSEYEDTIVHGLSPFNDKILIINDKYILLSKQLHCPT
jgi:hypothetical protein